MLGHFPRGIIELVRLHVSTGILTKWIKTNVKEKFLTFNIAQIYIVMYTVIFMNYSELMNHFLAILRFIFLYLWR